MKASFKGSGTEAHFDKAILFQERLGTLRWALQYRWREAKAEGNHQTEVLS